MKLSLDKRYLEELEDYFELITIDGVSFAQYKVEDTIGLFDAAFRKWKGRTGLFESDLPDKRLAGCLVQHKCLERYITETGTLFYETEPGNWHTFVKRVGHMLLTRSKARPQDVPVSGITPLDTCRVCGYSAQLLLSRPFVPVLRIQDTFFSLAYLEDSLKQIRKHTFRVRTAKDKALLDFLHIPCSPVRRMVPRTVTVNRYLHQLEDTIEKLKQKKEALTP